jgi:hypothetical protein
MTVTFEMSADTRLLKQVLAKAKVGDTITDADLGAAIDKTVDGSTGNVRTAIKRLQRDEGMVFGRVTKVGWKRLNDQEIVATGVRDVDQIRRKASRSVERQMKADFDNLNNKEKAQFTAQVSVMASVSMMTRPASLAKVEDIAKSDTKELPVSQTLKMFAGA